MPRRAKFVYPELAHHITRRGNNRQNVFFTDSDRTRYLESLRSHLDRYQVRVLAWCLMSNHIHPVAIPPRPESFSLALGQAHSQYALDWNRHHQCVGHLWQNRFFSCSLDGEHLLAAMRYVELNPVRAGMVLAASQWPWSSAAAHVETGSEDALLDPEWREWLARAQLAEWDFEHWRGMLGEAQTEEELASIRRATYVGEPLGSREFVQKLEAISGRRLKVLGRGRPAKERAALASEGQGSLFG